MTRKVDRSQELLLLPAEVGQLFRVDPKTVTRWVKNNRIGATRTLGGHHRFHPEEVRKLIELNYTGGNLQDRLDDLDRMIERKKDEEKNASGTA